MRHPEREPSRTIQPKIRAWLQRPSLYLYLAAALGLCWGQVKMFSEQLASGLVITLLSLLPLGLALLGDRRLQAGLKAFLTLVERGSRWLEEVKHPEAKSPPAPVAGKAAGGPRSAAPDKTAQPKPAPWPGFAGLLALWQPLSERLAAVQVTLPRGVLLAAAVALLLAAQPFLFLEKFFAAALLLAPGLGLLITSCTRKEKVLRLGSLDVWVRAVLLGLPGIILIVIGNLILLKYVQLQWQKEAVGIACNTVGLLLLLGLMPQKFLDPEPEAGSPLDDFPGAARSPWGLALKAGLAVAGLVCLFLIRQAAAHSTWQGLLLALVGLALLALSFPWAYHRPAPRPEPNALAGAGLRLVRLAAFLVAVYLGYRGQKLISLEQLYPGLFHFLFAGILLAVAFREPARGKDDPLREKPLPWYWEAAGLVLLLAVGIWLRTYLLDKIPYGIEGDEAGGFINAREIFRGNSFSIVAHPVGQPVFYLVQLKLESLLLGLGNWGVKFHALAYGILDIFALYLMSRLFFGPRAALATAALLVFSRWHIHFSRFGYANTMFIFFTMMGFYFLIKGLHSRRKWHFALGGMSLAFSLTTEVAARLLPIIGLGIMGYLMVQQRHFLRRNWKPLLVVVLGAWLASGPLLILYAKSSTALMGRAQSVSIFSNDPNAPRDLAAGLVSSIKGSLTMLNWHGDTRTRHNGGLSGEPMLDFWTAILFVLGLGYCLYYWKRLRYFIPLIWFFGIMSASVFSIEAPQAHRAFGILPPLLLMSGAFLDRARRLLREVLGRPGALAGGLAFAVLLVPIGNSNYHKYFDTVPTFDANCCEHAKYLGRLGPNWEHFIMTAYLWQGHPPFMLYAQDISGRFFYSAANVVPMYVNTTKNVCYSFVFEYPPLLPAVQYFYPKGKLREVSHPKYGLMFQGWEVQNADIMATRGLTARYWNNMDWAGQPAVTRKDPSPNLDFDRKTWPLSGAGSAEWEGTLLVPHYGRYTIYLSGTDSVEAVIGRTHVLSTGGGRETQTLVKLAGGLHRLRVRARHTTPDGSIRMSWSSPEDSTYTLYKDNHSQPFGKEAVPPNFLYTYAEPKGLLETYYQTADWTGEPQLRQVQPALLFNFMNTPYGLSTPISADWRGWITVPQDGEYSFHLEQPGYGEVVIDDTVAVKTGAPPQGYSNPAPAANPIRLAAGRHRILVRWSVRYGMALKLWWTPPGGKQAIVPPAVLTPQED